MTKKWAIGERAERRWTHTHALKHEWRAQFVAKKAAICVDFESFSHGSEWLPLLCVAELPLSASQKIRLVHREFDCVNREDFSFESRRARHARTSLASSSRPAFILFPDNILSRSARVLLWLLLLPRSRKSHQQPLSMAYRAARRRWDFLCTKLFTTAHSSRNVTQNWVICEFDGIDWTCWYPFLEVSLFFRLVNYFIN